MPRLAQAARRLAGLPKGLSDALPTQAASVGRQPWALASLRPAAAAATADAPEAAEPAAGGSSSASAAAGAVVGGAAAAARPPPGHTDFAQRQLLMLFTCSKCNTRAAKAFSKQSYERGLVIVECPGCHNKHLIADHLGWFGTKGTVEEFAAERGNAVVRRLADGTLELSPEELLGSDLAGAAEAAAAAATGGSSGTAAPV